MTRKQYNISQKNKGIAWKKICGSSRGIRGMVLHHKDTELLHNNIERYIEWRLSDLEMLTKSDHVKLHRTGTHHKQSTKRKMREAKLGVPKSFLHRQHMSESHKRYWALKKATEILQLNSLTV